MSDQRQEVTGPMESGGSDADRGTPSVSQPSELERPAQPDAPARAPKPVRRRVPRKDRAAEAARGLPDSAHALDLPTIAVAAGASLRTVQSWVSSGKLRVVRIGRVARVRLPDWVAFLEANVVP